MHPGAPNPNEFENQTFAGIAATSTTTDNSFNTWAVGTLDSNGNPVPSAAATRTPLVFVAANDGMLHAFNAGTGAEVYAFLPGAVITGGGAAVGGASQLATLANPGCGSTSLPHAYCNDGELTIADVFFNSAWHTVLVGTTSRIAGAGNRLAAPVAWMGDPTTGISTQAYAGDLQGQVWSFPLSVPPRARAVAPPRPPIRLIPVSWAGRAAPVPSSSPRPPIATAIRSRSRPGCWRARTP